MLGMMASKYEKGNPYIYRMIWFNPEKPLEKKAFFFALLNDDNLLKTDFNKLSGLEGQMIIQTKSLIDFKPNDVCIWTGTGDNQKYTIINVDGNRKGIAENANMLFKHTGNVKVKITLRRCD